jgi:hypothetical protein
MVRSENPVADASLSPEIPGWLNGRVKSRATKRAETLDELEAQFIAIRARFEALVESAGSELSTKAPAPGSWSPSECIQHLNISADAYFPIWQQVIASAGPRKAEQNAPYHTDFWGRFLSWILEPPPRIRSRTPAPFEPIESSNIAQILDGFCNRQERIIAAVRRCRGRAIDQVKMASPVDARIRYSIWSSFLVNAAHQRRHLWQAEQVIQKLSAASL